MAWIWDVLSLTVCVLVCLCLGAALIRSEFRPNNAHSALLAQRHQFTSQHCWAILCTPQVVLLLGIVVILMIPICGTLMTDAVYALGIIPTSTSTSTTSTTSTTSYSTTTTSTSTTSSFTSTTSTTRTTTTLTTTTTTHTGSTTVEPSSTRAKTSARITTTSPRAHLPHEATTLAAASSTVADMSIVNVFTTAAPTTLVSTSTTAFVLQKATVSLQMTVQNIDHSGLRADSKLCDAFESRLKSAIAAEAGHGVSSSSVRLTLAEGSIRVDATISDLDGAVAFLVKTNLESRDSQLSRRVQETVGKMHGIDKVSTGQLHVSDVSATSAITSEGGNDVESSAWQAKANEAIKVIESVEESVRQQLPPALKPYSKGAILAVAGFLVLTCCLICLGSAGRKGTGKSLEDSDQDDYQSLALVNPDELGMYEIDPTTHPGSEQYLGNDVRSPNPEDPLEDEEADVPDAARGLGMHQQEPPDGQGSARKRPPGAAGPRKDKAKAAAEPPALAAEPVAAGDQGNAEVANYLRLAEDMGFSQEQALHALDQLDGNTEAALESLLAPA